MSILSQIFSFEGGYLFVLYCQYYRDNIKKYGT